MVKGKTTTASAAAAGGPKGKGASAGGVSKASKTQKVKHPLFEAIPKNFGVGQSLPYKRDLTRKVKWPSYIQIQRKRAILLKKLKIPPAINQFRHTVNKNEATQLFRLLGKYRPENREARRARLLERAAALEAGKEVPEHKKPLIMASGLNEIVSLIERKKVALVVIAHDVDPIELVIFLPTLCRKMGVPYCIVKGKARLGALVHMKTCSCVGLREVRKEDQAALDQLVKNLNPEFIDNLEVRRRWGN